MKTEIYFGKLEYSKEQSKEEYIEFLNNEKQFMYMYWIINLMIAVTFIVVVGITLKYKYGMV